MIKKILAVVLAIVIIWALNYFISPIFDVRVVNDGPVISNDATIEGGSEVRGTQGHPASGEMKVIHNGNNHIIRFEEFKTINGPQLHVYLAKDLDAKEFVDLGPIRGTEGNINYSVPYGVDVKDYKYVMHWCVPFGVLFNYAELPIVE